ncbi:hypothetical protein [Elizabethkingia sp. JS20170427COW]|uniref:hypothetical protein n=1 Tax=Elizabethkingia sp. JS20170427COW TaxID=2583851 RepID=UPI00111013FE|nr:hypothetical protein [Elizabethkingia sp. JS20170427COW]QCX52834.1 hypothetical protein FGE20_03290 [Elizabethkingia sp. JS20170427COW]
MKFFVLFMTLVSIFFHAQQKVFGTISDENNQPLAGIQVINMRTSEKTFSTTNGNFTILANIGDELRWVSKAYNRYQLVITPEQLNKSLNIHLSPFVQEIAPVTILSDKQVSELQEKIGLPPSAENPREKAPPTVKEAGWAGYIYDMRNLNNLYKNISGDARRMRSLYLYEDQQNSINKVLQYYGTSYFQELEIPTNKERDFIQFVMGKEKISFSKNINYTLLEMAFIRFVPEYLKLIQNKP